MDYVVVGGVVLVVSRVGGGGWFFVQEVNTEVAGENLFLFLKGRGGERFPRISSSSIGYM